MDETSFSAIFSASEIGNVIIDKSILGGNPLVITPEDGIGGSSIFAAGDTLTSNAASRAVQLLFDGANWQVVAGEITGTAEMVIA